MNQKELLEYRFQQNKCFACGKESIGGVTLTGKHAQGKPKHYKQWNFCHQHQRPNYQPTGWMP